VYNFFPSLSSVSKYLCQIPGEHASGPHVVVLSPSGGGTFVTATIHECPPPAHRGSVAASLSSVRECTVPESISAAQRAARDEKAIRIIILSTSRPST